MANDSSAVGAPRSWVTSPLTILSLFLVLVFLTGGTRMANAGQLIILRPVAIMVAAFGLYRMRAEHWRAYWPLWALLGAAIALTVAHLVPLPFSWWSALPGRALIVDIDAAVGLGKIARPLSMHPEATMNALLSLSVPLAVLTLAVQLDETGQRRIASLLLLLIATSAFIGLLQLSGMPIALYNSAPGLNPSGLLNNRNHQGLLLALALPLAVLAWRGGYGWVARPSIERFAVLALVLFILPLVVVTGSRAGLVLAAFGLVLALLALPAPADRARVRQVSALRYLAVLGIVGVMVWLTVYTSRDVALERIADSGEDLRFPVWKSIIDAIPAYWPWGTGIGSYVDAYQILEPDELLRPTYSNNAHNDWLEVVFTAGLPGALILLAAVVAAGIAAFRLLRSSQQQNALGRIGLIVLIMLAFASISDYPVRTPILSAVLVLAAVWAARGRGGQVQQGRIG